VQEIGGFINHPAILRRIVNNYAVPDTAQAQASHASLVIFQPTVATLYKSDFNFSNLSHDFNP